jgi:hypothetical protein
MGMYGAAFKKARPWVRVTATAVGGLGGLAPDAIPWVGQFFGGSYFELKAATHTGDIFWWFVWNIGYDAHVFIDSYAHRLIDWWDTLWPLEVGCWLIGGGLLLFAFWKEGKAWYREKILRRSAE